MSGGVQESGRQGKPENVEYCRIGGTCKESGDTRGGGGGVNVQIVKVASAVSEGTMQAPAKQRKHEQCNAQTPLHATCAGSSVKDTWKVRGCEGRWREMKGGKGR